MKFCNRCKLAIDTKKERHIKIEDNQGEENLKKIYLHKECWKDLITQKKQVVELQNKAKNLIDTCLEELTDRKDKYTIK